jgi:hypothetical protein
MEVVTKFALILPEKMRHANSFCFSVYGFGLSQTKTLSETDMPRSYFILSFFSFSLLTIYESTKNLPRRVSHTCFCAHIFNCPKTPRKNPVFFIAGNGAKILTILQVVVLFLVNIRSAPDRSAPTERSSFNRASHPDLFTVNGRLGESKTGTARKIPETVPVFFWKLLIG